MALGIPSSTESTLILPTQPGWWSFSFDVLVSEILQVRNFNRSIYVFQTDQAGERIPRFVLKTERNEMGDLQTFLSRCGDSGTPNEFFALICWNSISHLIWLTRGDRAYAPDEIFPSQGSAGYSAYLNNKHMWTPPLPGTKNLWDLKRYDVPLAGTEPLMVGQLFNTNNGCTEFLYAKEWLGFDEGYAILGIIVINKWKNARGTSAV
ncbi:hypothetical protein AGABI2DRAFT_119032 [Agaricus bisporus var. bisporus H97]|uniref:hypothetical protein n=1 Tax=Agaricus bisporus var. bisporus (strain H97 / ATCC MYA-4626 / FGSC 10389) TaxID=936046 RepID=UPI00029F7440|nr:hypothetical protein AGABI2DRAFT_119032 [Agaricus bisporus var. bisporus H97]EKV46852.1 hypothetical protein AGABI2DRAFT_119032 [Agaricus bisporus var. bisporus H97]